VGGKKQKVSEGGQGDGICLNKKKLADQCRDFWKKRKKGKKRLYK